MVRAARCDNQGSTSNLLPGLKSSAVQSGQRHKQPDTIYVRNLYIKYLRRGRARNLTRTFCYISSFHLTSPQWYLLAPSLICCGHTKGLLPLVNGLVVPQLAPASAGHRALVLNEISHPFHSFLVKTLRMEGRASLFTLSRPHMWLYLRPGPSLALGPKLGKGQPSLELFPSQLLLPMVSVTSPFFIL